MDDSYYLKHTDCSGGYTRYYHPQTREILMLRWWSMERVENYALCLQFMCNKKEDKAITTYQKLGYRADWVNDYSVCRIVCPEKDRNTLVDLILEELI